jgi:hypothetical protein
MSLQPISLLKLKRNCRCILLRMWTEMGSTWEEGAALMALQGGWDR